MPSSISSPHGGDDSQVHTDPKLRRRLQNRIAQRNSRQRKASQNGSSQDNNNIQQTYCHRCCGDNASRPGTVSGHPTAPMAKEQQSPPRNLPPSTGNAIPHATVLASPTASHAVVSIMSQDPQYNVDYFGSRLGSQHGNDFLSSFTFELNPDLTDSRPEEVELLNLDPKLKPFDSAGPPASDSSDQETQVPPDHEYDVLGLPLSPTSQIHGHGTLVDWRRRNGSQATTPLHVCSRMGNQKILEILLQNGADINAVDGEGRTALHYGAQSGHEEVVRALLKQKADPSILDHQGMSVMHVAVVNSQERIVILLLEAGVDPNI